MLVIVLCLAAFSTAATAEENPDGTMPAPGFGTNPYYDGEYIDPDWPNESYLPLMSYFFGLTGQTRVVELPFLFPFHGVYHDRVYVSSNGLISFEGLDGTAGDWEDLVEKRAIAASWWLGSHAGGLYSVQWSPGPDKVVFLWNVTGSSPSANEDTLTAVVLEPDGTITIQFHPDMNMDWTTVGISDPDKGYLIAYDGEIVGGADGVRFNHIPIEPIFDQDGDVGVTPGCEGPDTVCIGTNSTITTQDYRVIGDVVVPGQEVNNETFVPLDLGPSFDEVENQTGLRPMGTSDEGITVDPSPYNLSVEPDPVTANLPFQNVTVRPPGVSYSCEEGLVVSEWGVKGGGVAAFNATVGESKEPPELARERCRLMDQFGLLEPMTISP